MDHYEVVYDKIFVLKNLKEAGEVFCTFNVEEGTYDYYMGKTIMVHRKKDTNTLYTINALNELIKHLNDGELDKSFQIPWENYKNSLLVTNEGEFRRFDTKLFDIVEV
jgi:hypothetical protein